MEAAAEFEAVEMPDAVCEPHVQHVPYELLVQPCALRHSSGGYHIALLGWDGVSELRVGTREASISMIEAYCPSSAPNSSDKVAKGIDDAQTAFVDLYNTHGESIHALGAGAAA